MCNERRVWRRKRMKDALLLPPFFLLVLIFLASSCTTETYETGDGKYSYLRADFVEAHTIAEKTIDQAVTDDGEHLLLIPYATAAWAVKPDTVYRALLYYDCRPGQSVTPVSLMRVLVLRPQVADEFDGDLPTDPLTLESAWIGKDRKYLNLSLILKTGSTDDQETMQSVALVKEGDHTLRLLHDQGGVPEYYSTRVYASIPLSVDLLSEPLRLLVRTYQGDVERYF